MSLAVAWMWKVVGRYREAPAKLETSPRRGYGDLARNASTPL